MSVKTVSITVPIIDGIKTAEEFIAYAARVSNPANQLNIETAPKLLKYLIKNKHWSPFEMVSMTMEIKTTRDIAHQILRHRSFSFQEFSQRYANVNEMGFIHREARLQDNKNRQNSLKTDDAGFKKWWDQEQIAVINHTRGLYKRALDMGMAKEQARVVLPEGLTSTTLYMSGTARSWIHYIQLRTEVGTQLEHREIAEGCKREFIVHFPSLSEVLNEN